MQRNPSDTENKLVLLHAVNRLGGVTAQQLLLFMVENEAMGYIEVQLGLAELVDADLLQKQKHALGTLYLLTGKGHDSLSMFRDRVPHSRLSAIEERVEAWRQRFRREKQMLADFQKLSGDEYCVHLQLLERNSSLLDMKISVPTPKIAQRFCDAWIAQASSIYTHIMYTLGETALSPQEDSPPVP